MGVWLNKLWFHLEHELPFISKNNWLLILRKNKSDLNATKPQMSEIYLVTKSQTPKGQFSVLSVNVSRITLLYSHVHVEKFGF